MTPGDDRDRDAVPEPTALTLPETAVNEPSTPPGWSASAEVGVGSFPDAPARGSSLVLEADQCGALLDLNEGIISAPPRLPLALLAPAYVTLGRP